MYNTMRIIMMDKMFEDEWVEPYEVTLYLDTDLTSRQVASEIQSVANDILNDIDCSEEGIRQILEEYKEKKQPSLVIVSINNAPGVCFGKYISEE